MTNGVAHQSPPRYVMNLRARQYEMGPFGHINYAVYLNYLEQAAAEHHAALGLTLARLRELGGGFTVRDLELHYLVPAVMDDSLTITTWLESCAGARAVRLSEIRRRADNVLLVTARAQWVWIDLRNGRPRRIPPEVLTCLYPPEVTEEKDKNEQ